MMTLAWLCNLSPLVYTEEAKTQRGTEQEIIGIWVNTHCAFPQYCHSKPQGAKVFLFILKNNYIANG